MNKIVKRILIALGVLGIIIIALYVYETHRNFSDLYVEESAEKTAQNFMILNGNSNQPRKDFNMSSPSTEYYEIYNINNDPMYQGVQLKVFKNPTNEGVYKIEFRTYSFRSIAEQLDTLGVIITDQMKNYFKNPEETEEYFINGNSYMFVSVDTTREALNSTEDLPEETQKNLIKAPHITFTITTNKDVIHEYLEHYKRVTNEIKELKKQELKEKEFDEYK